MRRGSNENHNGRINRRAMLSLGGVGLGGLTLDRILQANETRPSSLRARAKNVIFLHQYGGPSHIDTFDLKPHAPTGIRGEFTPIDSSVPGVPVCEHLPRWGTQLNKWAQIRSVHHDMKNHNSACYYSLTGKRPPTDDIRLRDTMELYPAFGSSAAKFLSTPEGVPPFIAYPYVLRDGAISPGQHASFLGKRYDPFFFESDPNSADFGLPELELPNSISLERLGQRRELLRVIDDQLRLADRSSEAKGLDEFQRQSLSILSSPNLKKAFDLAKEDDALRDRYGRTTYGQSCLLARRLVEAGARFVNVYFSRSIGGKGSEGWDTHQENFKDLRERLLPVTDCTVPTLIDDLDSRGLLEDTLVLWMGEFGRGPQVGDRDGKGRGHWPHCYTVMMAGGGIRGGTIFGKSDERGAYPAASPVGPEDISATLFWALGIEPDKEIRDTQGRPLPIASGSPIESIFS